MSLSLLSLSSTVPLRSQTHGPNDNAWHSCYERVSPVNMLNEALWSTGGGIKPEIVQNGDQELARKIPWLAVVNKHGVCGGMCAAAAAAARKEKNKRRVQLELRQTAQPWFILVNSRQMPVFFLFHAKKRPVCVTIFRWHTPERNNPWKSAYLKMPAFCLAYLGGSCFCPQRFFKLTVLALTDLVLLFCF